MKIGINAFCFEYPATGMGQYLIHLANTLIDMDQQNQYSILGPTHNLPDNFQKKQFHSVHSVPSWAQGSKQLERMIWDQWTAPAIARKIHADLYHVPYFTPPLFTRVPTVITIHDMIPFRLPLYRTESKFTLYTQLVAHAAHRARLIITVSQHAKQDIIELLKIRPERIRVIYEAAGKEYRVITDPEVLARVRERYKLGTRYIFYLGGLDQRKNVLQLIHAFARLCQRLVDPNLQLLIAGEPEKRSGPLFPDPRPLATALRVAHRINYHFVEEKDKPALYSGADVFVYPSSYEGFGLPPLEAMACGSPVVCSNATSLPEVVGTAAISYDPNNIDALTEALYAVLSNPTLKAELCIRSLQHASHFTWAKAAGETIEIYQEALTQGKR